MVWVVAPAGDDEVITNTEILSLAMQCGDYNGQTVEMNNVGLEAFARLVGAKTREECAAECERLGPILADTYGISSECIRTAEECAAAIRGSK